MREVSFCPGTKAANTEISLPTGSLPIDSIVNVTLFRGSDGTATATEVSATATKVDESKIKLNVATTTRDLLNLRYLSIGEVLRP